jgi:hypothetical protein
LSGANVFGASTKCTDALGAAHFNAGKNSHARKGKPSRC